MGQELSTAKCPHCGQAMHSVKSAMTTGPSWMFVDAPGSLHGNVVLVVCPNFQCSAVLGSFYELVKMPDQR